MPTVGGRQEGFLDESVSKGSKQKEEWVRKLGATSLSGGQSEFMSVIH